VSLNRAATSSATACASLINASSSPSSLISATIGSGSASGAGGACCQSRWQWAHCTLRPAEPMAS
jgi:hypothetical protein